MKRWCSPPAHHARPRKQCVVKRVGLDVAVGADELNLDDDEIVDVVEVLADGLLRMPGAVDTLDDEVAGRSSVDLTDGVAS